MSGEREGKGNRRVIILGISVLLLLLVVVLATPLKEWIFVSRSAPTIELEIIEGELDEETGLYGYLVGAMVTGRPAPDVLFNRNDGIGEVESNHTLILLLEGDNFLLQATASNALGSAAASLDLSGGIENVTSSDTDAETQGIIEGHLVYPSEGVPPDLIVVAENLSTGQEYFADGVITDSKYATGFGFVIPVPPGNYHVYAFNPGDDYRAYYDEYVQSNYTVDSHEKIVVAITAGLHVDDAIVGNWWIVPEDSSNQPPVISGIDFSADTLYTDESYTATARASDPDGDTLSYSWQLTRGGWLIAESTGNPLNFTAPSEAGEYQFRVVVSDGRGVEADYSETVSISHLISEYVAVPTPSETGHIIKDHEANSHDFVYAGDLNDNRMVRAFISFDIGPLAGASINEVELRLKNPNELGDPSVFHHGSLGLWVGVVHWGARPLQRSDYGIYGLAISSYTDYDITLQSTMGESNEKLAQELQKAIDEGKNRFQIRLHFAKDSSSNNNNLADAVWYGYQNITLTVLYEE